jgi:hypothetical protein
MAVCLLAEARHRPSRPALLGLLVLALTVPVLAAGQFADQRAVASALRWGLGICFLACSFPLWFRERLARWGEARGLRTDTEYPVASFARRLLVAATVVPVIALTLVAVGAAYTGHPVAGPLPASFFVKIGGLAARVVPLLLICVTLVVHALREQLPGYAFTVGLGGNLMASLIVRAAYRRVPVEDWWAPLLQANALAFAAMALLWLATRKRLYGERGTGGLLVAQVSLGVLATFGLLAAGLVLLVTNPTAAPAPVAQIGGVWGWLALALASGSLLWHTATTGRRDEGPASALILLAVGVMAACMVSRWAGPPWLAYHVLTAAWAVTGALLLAVGWRASQSMTGDAFTRIIDRGGWAVPWVLLCGLLVIGLALRGAADDPETPYWAAGALLAVSALYAGLGVWQRRESWAFAAALLVNLAVSLVLGEYAGFSLAHLDGVPFLHANLLAGALAAAAWLAAGRALRREDGDGPLPLLTVYLILLVLGNVVLLAGAGTALILTPDPVPAFVAKAGGVGGTLALLATVTVVLLHLGSLPPRLRVHVVGVLGVALGVLVACTAAEHEGDHGWLGYHVLILSGAILGAGLLAAGAGGRRRLTDASVNVTGAVRDTAWLPAAGVRGWVVGLAAALVLLALRGVAVDPDGPEWSAAAVLAAAGLCTGLALFWRREKYLFAAGLGVQLAVSLVLCDWQSPLAWLSGHGVLLVQVNIMVAAGSALIWLLLAPHLYGVRRPGLAEAPLLGVQVLLPLGGNLALLVGPLVLLLHSPGAPPAEVSQAGGPLGWAALGLAMAAVLAYSGRELVRGGVHLLACLGLVLGVLAACTAAAFDGGDFFAYHTLTAAWAAFGLLLLSAGWKTTAARGVETWVVTIGALVLGLALRGVSEDPARPWWPAGAVLAVSGFAAGLAVWLRREHWAFVAGLLINLAVSLVLWEQHRGADLADWWVLLVQANVVAAGLVALAWLAWVRRDAFTTSPLLSVQILLGLAGDLLLLGSPAFWLVWRPGDLPDSVGHAGTVAGWAALLATTAAALARFRGLLDPVRVHVVGAAGVAVGVLAACTAAGYEEQYTWFAYHVLTLAGAAVGGILLASGMAPRRRFIDIAPGAEANLAGDTAVSWSVRAWVVALGGAVVALALRGVASDPAGPAWSAGAVLAASALFAALAVLVRRELWLFTAGLGVQLATSLVLCDWSRPADYLREHWVLLVQANTLAAAAVAFVWLLLCRRLYGVRRPDLPAAPLLGLQVILPLAGNAALLVGPLVLLVRSPGALPPQVPQAGHALGWLALMLAMAAGLGYAGRGLLRSALHLLASLGLALGVLAACTAAHFDGGDFLAYHALTAAWAALGVLFLAGGMVAACRGDSGTEAGRGFAAWVIAVGALVLGLALRGAVEDPGAPAWPAGAILVVSGLAAGLALWRRREPWAFVASVLVNLAVSLVLWHRHDLATVADWWVELVQANTVAASLAALVWMLSSRRLYQTWAPPWDRAPLLTAQVALGLAGNAALLGEAVARLVLDPGDVHEHVRQAGGPWGWVALLAGGAVSAWYLRLRRARGAGICAGGLSVAALAACTAAVWDTEHRWLAYHVLTVGWALTGVAVLLRGGMVWRALRYADAASGSDVRAPLRRLSYWLILPCVLAWAWPCAGWDRTRRRCAGRPGACWP